LRRWRWKGGVGCIHDDGGVGCGAVSTMSTAYIEEENEEEWCKVVE
jgi:hypothetical protein